MGPGVVEGSMVLKEIVPVSPPTKAHPPGVMVKVYVPESDPPVVLTVTVKV